MSKINTRNILFLPALLFVICHTQNTKCEWKKCKKLKPMTNEDIKKFDQKRAQMRILDLAQKENYQEVMTFIHQYGYFDFTGEQQKTNLLEIAIHTNNYDDVNALLSCGANPSSTVTTCYIPIIFKAIGKPKILRLLLQNGACPNFRCIRSTPLIYAVKENCIESVKLLLQYGADIQMREFISKRDRSEKGKTALDYALEKGYENIANLIQNS